MDFIEQLANKVNTIIELPKRCEIGYLGTGESFCVYPLAGSRTVLEYMDGAKDVQLNYEFSMKSPDQKKINDTLWYVSDFLDNLTELESKDDSFIFNDIQITNKPFINQMDDKKTFIFMLDIQANITIHP